MRDRELGGGDQKKDMEEKLNDMKRSALRDNKENSQTLLIEFDPVC